jgi:hypothetical protein
MWRRKANGDEDCQQLAKIINIEIMRKLAWRETGNNENNGETKKAGVI